MVSSRLFVWGLVLVILLILLPTPGETRSKDKSRQKHVKHRDREEREMREHHHHQPQAQLRYNDELKKKKKKEQHLQPPQNQKQKQKQKLKHGSDTKKHNAKDKNMKKNHQKPKKDKDKKKKKKIKDGMEHDFAVDVHCGADGEACPDSLPCCSQWGFCGVGPLYCGQGCQGQFGQCGEDATVNDGPGEADNVGDGKHRNKNNRGGKKKHHPHGKSHGFDLQDRIRGSNSQEGLALRIPASVPKLPPNDTLVNIAYFPGWTQYRGQGRNNCHQRPYIPSAIPWSSLDYVMFAFVYFDEDNELYPADPSDEDLYFTINRLKQPTQTRVMISIGGWSFTHPDSQRDEGMQHRFETMMLSASSRTQFIESCIEFVKFYGFDGVDIDYEYPTFHEREYVTLLFQEMRKAFDAEGSGLVLSLAGASFAEGVQGFELDKIAEAVDFMMIMAYDLYGAYDSTKLVNIHTTLFQMPTENHGGHSVQGAVELYLDHGVPREKIVLGLALYGKTFLLTDSHNTAPGRAPFKAGGDPSSCIETRGDIAYNEIAPLIHSGNPTQPIWDEDSKAFYFVYGKHHNNWVGYDDRPSLDLKLQMAVELDLAGVMWWSLDQDLDATSQDLAHPIQKRSEEGVGEVRRRAIPQVPFHPPAAPPKTYLPKAPDENRQGDTALQETESCPAIASPPEDLANISTDLLGKPGLVPYVASKRKRCPVVVEYPHVLPAAPVGNIVMTKCNAPADLSCPESWQAFVCQADGWSEASPCYDKAELSPSLYFYGDMVLVRKTARDRNVQDGMASNAVGNKKKKKPDHRKLSSLIGSKRPAYINKAQKMQLQKQLLKSIQEKKMRKQERDKKCRRGTMDMQKTSKKKNKAKKTKHERKIKSMKKKT